MTPTREEWRPIPGYEGFYEASDRGRIRSVDRAIVRSNGAPMTCKGRIRVPAIRTADYGVVCCVVRLSRKGVLATRTVHSLVMEAFVGPRPSGADICHNNGDPTDNRLSNLRYDSRSANHRDSVRHGTHHGAKKTHCLRGHRLAHPNLSLSDLRRGHRYCRACMRARSNVRIARAQSRPYDFDKWADEHYARIMKESP